MPRSSATTIPLAPIERLMIQAGAERVSIEGAAELSKVLERYALAVAHEALARSTRAGRKTVSAEDIHEARQSLGTVRL